MQARRVKALRRRQEAARTQQQLAVARGFFDTCWEVLGGLPAYYDCYLTCDEVEALAALARAFGAHEEDVQALIKNHGEDDEPGERHHVCTYRCDADCGQEVAA
ncbi:hypothetical protein [Streptomyces sp. NPDC057002]|uniref:hypothetical protein n=1 Tax=Streptomyces sp. NPDC057002 TaxID=3345992 RepID=UPI003639A2B9